MSNLPISSKYRSTPDAPVTDAEREALVVRLNAAYEAGKLDDDAYRGHLDRVFAASRLGELVGVVEALPPSPTHGVPAIVAAGTSAPGELTPSRQPTGRLLVTVGATAAVALVVLLVLLAVLL